jgi:Transmembrane family 220, helix
MFMVFTYLQFNDPDPVTWSLIYCTMVVVCLMAAFNIYKRNLILVQGAVYIIYGIILWPGVMSWLASPDRSKLFDDLAKMEYPYMEETREFTGLLICLAVLGFHWYRSSRRKGTHVFR